MKKKLIIIASPNKQHPHKKYEFEDSEYDVNGWKDFFLTKAYGSWQSNEIIDLKREDASISKIIPTIHSEIHDYLVIIFIGHGGYEKNKYFLRDFNGELFAEEQLFVKTTPQLIIIDACRKTDDIIQSTEHNLFDKKNKIILYSVLRGNESRPKFLISGINQFCKDTLSIDSTDNVLTFRQFFHLLRKYFEKNIARLIITPDMYGDEKFDPLFYCTSTI